MRVKDLGFRVFWQLLCYRRACVSQTTCSEVQPQIGRARFGETCGSFPLMLCLSKKELNIKKPDAVSVGSEN